MEKNKKAGNDIYGEYRIKLALYLRNKILNLIKNENFIENGTLLGAWRNNKFIAHEDDFDFAILINDLYEIPKIYKIISDNIDNKYNFRLVKNYANKIEVYDPKFGKYILDGKNYNNANFHNVTVDLQFYLKHDNCYKCLYHRQPKEFIKEDILLPLKKIMLEGSSFNCPNNTKKFLEINYGCLEKDVRYCEDTGLYHKI